MFMDVFSIVPGSSEAIFLAVHVSLISGVQTMHTETSVYGGMGNLHGTHMRAHGHAHKTYIDSLKFLKLKNVHLSEDKTHVWAFLLVLTYLCVGGPQYARCMCKQARKR